MSDNFPYLEEIVKEISPFPSNVIIFGMATDHFPVCYDVSRRDTPNVIIWDLFAGQGLAIVKTAIDFILHHRRGGRMEFVVLSNKVGEWGGVEGYGFGAHDDSECVAVVPFQDSVASQVLSQLAKWSESGREAKYPIILFLDGLENFESLDVEARHNLRVILIRGRNNGIYVIGTANSKDRDAVSYLSYYFHREIEGLRDRWFVLKETLEDVIFFTPVAKL